MTKRKSDSVRGEPKKKKKENVAVLEIPCKDYTRFNETGKVTRCVIMTDTRGLVSKCPPKRRQLPLPRRPKRDPFGSVSLNGGDGQVGPRPQPTSHVELAKKVGGVPEQAFTFKVPFPVPTSTPTPAAAATTTSGGRLAPVPPVGPRSSSKKTRPQSLTLPLEKDKLPQDESPPHTPASHTHPFDVRPESHSGTTTTTDATSTAATKAKAALPTRALNGARGRASSIVPASRAVEKKMSVVSNPSPVDIRTTDAGGVNLKTSSLPKKKSRVFNPVPVTKDASKDLSDSHNSPPDPPTLSDKRSSSSLLVALVSVVEFAFSRFEHNNFVGVKAISAPPLAPPSFVKSNFFTYLYMRLVQYARSSQKDYDSTSIFTLPIGSREMFFDVFYYSMLAFWMSKKCVRSLVPRPEALPRRASTLAVRKDFSSSSDAGGAKSLESTFLEDMVRESRDEHGPNSASPWVLDHVERYIHQHRNAEERELLVKVPLGRLACGAEMLLAYALMCDAEETEMLYLRSVEEDVSSRVKLTSLFPLEEDGDSAEEWPILTGKTKKKKAKM